MTEQAQTQTRPPRIHEPAKTEIPIEQVLYRQVGVYLRGRAWTLSGEPKQLFVARLLHPQVILGRLGDYYLRAVKVSPEDQEDTYELVDADVEDRRSRYGIPAFFRERLPENWTHLVVQKCIKGGVLCKPKAAPLWALFQHYGYRLRREITPGEYEVEEL